MKFNDWIVSYRVVAGTVGASGGDSNSAEGGGEKSGDELHVCGGGCLFGELL